MSTRAGIIMQEDANDESAVHLYVRCDGGPDNLRPLLAGILSQGNPLNIFASMIKRFEVVESLFTRQFSDIEYIYVADSDTRQLSVYKVNDVDKLVDLPDCEPIDVIPLPEPR